MSYNSGETALLFEASPTGWSGEEAQAAPRKQGNALAVVGAAFSFLPPVGLVLSAVGFTRSKVRRGAGRTVALALSAGKAVDTQARAELQLVADDVQ